MLRTKIIIISIVGIIIGLIVSLFILNSKEQIKMEGGLSENIHKISQKYKELCKLSNADDFLNVSRIKNSINKYKIDINIPIYYINLEKSTERKKHILQEKKIYNLENIFRIEAVNGKEKHKERDSIILNNNIYKYIFHADEKCNYTTAEVGCLLSHIKAIYTAYSNNDEIALIIEDDVSFVLSPFTEKIQDIISSAPDNWSIISLFNFKCVNKKHQKFIPHDLNNFCESTAVYIINRKGMVEFLSKIFIKNIINIYPVIYNEKQSNFAADYVIYNNVKHTYYYNGTPPIIPVFNTSTIHQDHSNNNMIGVEKILAYFFDTNQLFSLTNNPKFISNGNLISTNETVEKFTP